MLMLPSLPATKSLNWRQLRTEMKVIVTSAYSPDMVAASLSGGVERFIRKPYQIGELVDLLQQAIS